MTLSARNNIFKLGIVFSFLCLLMCLFASIKVAHIYPSMEGEITRRSVTILQLFTGKMLGTNLLAVHCGISVLALYSFLSLILIYFFFEKTQAPEILFVTFFAASLSIESLRLLLPISHVYEIPPLYLLVVSRTILFSRCFGIFSLFTASVYAVGLKAEGQRNVVLILIVTTLIITLEVPIDTQAWDSSLNMVIGFASNFKLIDSGTILITTVSFFIAAWSRSSREYNIIGTGAALAFLGRNILLNTDTWSGPPIGLAFLIVGTWLICTRLHKIYLWL